MSLLTLLRGSGSAAPSLALDSLSTGLLSAWGLRKLLTSYAGPCARIRRASDAVEQDIGFSGEHFDDAAFSSFIGVSSGTVVTLYDQSGNAKHFQQPTAANQPTLTLAGQNGRAVLTFVSASSKFMTVPADKVTWNPFHTATKGTLYIVSDNDNNGGNKVLLATINQLPDRGFWVYRQATGALVQDIGRAVAGGAATATFTPATLNASVLTCLFDGTNATAANRVLAWQDGSAMTGANALTSAGTDGNANYDLALGTRGNTVSIFLQGWISEVAMWSGDRTANRTTWEANSKAYWGTP